MTPDQEQDRVLDHEYDGIQEYDNRLPNWWLFTLYGAIVFAVLYWFTMHTWRIGELSQESYRGEMARAAELQLARMAGKEVSDESLTLMSQVPATVARGQAIFEQFCVTCHKADASGQVGPNLTDAYWLHGGRPLQILNTVTHGVPDKGMAAWGNQLGPTRIQDVVSFVLTVKNKNRPGKEPQGVLEEEGAAGAAAAGPPAGGAAPGTAAAGATPPPPADTPPPDASS